MLVSVCGGNVISELQEQLDPQSRDSEATAGARAGAALEKEANEVCLDTSSAIVSL